MRSTIDNLAAKTVAEAKGVKAELKGYSGVFKTLMEEHGEASVLLKRLKSEKDTVERVKRWTELRQALLTHEKGELSAVYSELSRFPQTQAVAEEHAREAGELEAAIHKLDAVGPVSHEWPDLLEELAALVQAHVEAEESEYFKVAEEALGSDQAEALEGRYLAAKARADNEAS